MPADARQTLLLPDEAATARAGSALGRALSQGDVVLLEGPLGAGKSALARAAITARLADEGRQEETPSPTYTLVQTYPSPRGDVWHADLYRLTDPDEALELGLSGAFADAICLIEWPERLGRWTPPRALVARMGFPATGEGRTLTLAPRVGGWDAALTAVAATA